ncbi:uncharacterized protein LOC134819241 isoform X2 [Bolinopsis microptera]|uniref:uncharacterized protein LOC134819241 isoform X2 n=1 Tax=Bolinopsis microptera TaxID=2820187 RepID=UPI003078EE1A
MCDMNPNPCTQNENPSKCEKTGAILENVLCENSSSTVSESVLLEVVRKEVPRCNPAILFSTISESFSSVRKLSFQSEVIYSGIGLRMSSLHSLAGEWEADIDKPVYNQNSSPTSEQSRWSLVMKSVDFHKWVLYCSELDIREVTVYRNMSWKVWCGEHVIQPSLFPHASPYITNYADFKKILLMVQSGSICTGIPRLAHSPKRRRGATCVHSEECERIIMNSTQSVCQACYNSAEINERNSEVVELDGKVTKVTDSIETLQEIIHGLKVELEQLKRDHCAIMQYLLHLPSATQKLNSFSYSTPGSQKLRSSVHPYCSTASMENSPDELVNAIALAIQNRGGGGPHQSLLDGNRTEKCPTGIATKGTEFDDIMHFGDDISIAKSQLYSIITKARNCAHPQTKLITMLVKNLIPDYEGKSYTRLDPSHTNILRSLYFTVFPVDVDDNVVDDDMRERIKTRIEEEIWQKLKVTITDCCRKAKPKPAVPASTTYYPTHVPLPTISASGSRSLSPNLTQAINSHIFSTLSHQSFNAATTLAMSNPSALSMVNTIKTEGNHH